MVSRKIIVSFGLVLFLQGCSQESGPARSLDGSGPAFKPSLRGSKPKDAGSPMEDDGTTALIANIHVQREKIHKALEVISALQEVEEIGEKNQHDGDVMLQKFKERKVMHDHWMALFNEELNSNSLSMLQLKTEITDLFQDVTKATKEIAAEAKKLRAAQMAKISQAQKLSEAMTLIDAMNADKFEAFKANPEMSELWSHLFGKGLDSEQLTLAQMEKKVKDFITNQQENHDKVEKSCKLLGGGFEL